MKLRKIPKKIMQKNSLVNHRIKKILRVYKDGFKFIILENFKIIVNDNVKEKTPLTL